jgi:hypothetical protein
MRSNIFLLILAVFLFCSNSMAQQKTKIGLFFKKISIAQSLATAESEALPAQFTVTWAKQQKASFLINTGIGIDQKILPSNKLFTSFTGEYHRNSLSDKEQNNIQFGFKGFYNFAGNDTLKYFLTFDPQFSRDFVEEKNSIQTNLLFSFKNQKIEGFMLGGRMFNKKQTAYTVISILGGPQIQYILNSDKDESLRGIKVRPLATLNTGIYFVRNTEIDNVYLSLTSGFTGRYSAVNSSSDGEKDTYQFRSDINYYFPTKPTKLSIGATYLNGSDPYTALARQQYFLVSFNVFLKR